jgi:hypothetical protein
MGTVVTLLKRVSAGLSLFTISMLPTSCQSVPPGNGMPQPKNEAASRGPIPAEDKLEIESKKLAGPGAIDCGRVKIKGDPKDATECAIGAQKAAKPFRIRYDLQGIDSLVAVAIVRTPSGTVGALTYDGDPSGGGHVGEVVYPKRCPEPVHLWINPSGRIHCFQQKPPRPKMLCRRTLSRTEGQPRANGHEIRLCSSASRLAARVTGRRVSGLPKLNAMAYQHGLKKFRRTG